MIVGLGDSYADFLGDLGDPLVWSPGSIESLKNQVMAEIQGNAVYVSALRSEGVLVVTDSLLASFKTFYNEAQAYFDGIGFFAKLTGSTVDRLKDLQGRNLTWRTLLESRARQYDSGVVPGPAPLGPNASALDQIAAKLGKVGMYLAIGGAALLAYKVASETGLLRSLARR